MITLCEQLSSNNQHIIITSLQNKSHAPHIFTITLPFCGCVNLNVMFPQTNYNGETFRNLIQIARLFYYFTSLFITADYCAGQNLYYEDNNCKDDT